jgi:DNA (cytosine-5)-methyltransferase 1
MPKISTEQVTQTSMTTEPLFLVVDLFCGAGGTTTGFDMAEGYAKVIACVNHDPKAIKSHWLNHPDVKHFEEDIRTLKLAELIKIVQYWRNKYPDAMLVLWASLECTNFSKAKGGQPRDADSRTLADHLHRYIVAIKPDYIQIENVVEFMSWGPLDENGKPISRKNGEDWLRWRNLICSHGYRDEWREMNSANYGAYTSRNRLFGIFAKDDLPIAWPQPTHAKNPSRFSMHGDLEKWKAVKEVLNFTDEGESIFTRSKPLSNKTLERIYAGLLKYVAKGDKAFISKYYSGIPSGKNKSVNVPAGSITTIDHHSVVQPISILKYNSTDKNGKHYPPSVDDPCPVVTTHGRLGLIQGEFLTIYNGKSLHRSVDDPSPVIACNDRLSLIQPRYFIDKHYGAAQNQSIDQPAGTILPNDKHRLVEATPFLLNPCWKQQVHSTDDPSPVLIAKQDKTPLYLVQYDKGRVAIAVYEDDSEVMIRIKEFMVIYELVDIKMRMLRVVELLKIQGFPEGYKLEGNQADQKKFIGNSVVPHVVKAWTMALAQRIIDDVKTQVA